MKGCLSQTRKLFCMSLVFAAQEEGEDVFGKRGIESCCNFPPDTENLQEQCSAIQTTRLPCLASTHHCEIWVHAFFSASM